MDMIQDRTTAKPGMQWLAQEMRSDAFWRQLPAEIRAGLSSEQESAIRTVAAGTGPRAHAVDYRVSFKLPIVGRVYFVLLAGRERRNSLRRSLDHALWPQSGLQYLVAGTLGLTATMLIAAIVVLLYAALR